MTRSTTIPEPRSPIARRPAAARTAAASFFVAALLAGCAQPGGMASGATSAGTMAAPTVKGASATGAPTGLIAMRSARAPAETMSRLEDVVKQRGLTVIARIDHAAGAKRIDRTLRPTELLIFGNPQGGTPLMECAQSAGIDLPLKALVWQDGGGQTWLGYNDPAWLAERHGAPACAAAENLRKALDGIAAAAVAP